VALPGTTLSKLEMTDHRLHVMKRGLAVTQLSAGKMLAAFDLENVLIVASDPVAPHGVGRHRRIQRGRY
jgi:hypothetical protein